ncbi:type II toxin-antitoxin system Phd/YefM family antitoxin [Calidithermus roseus]|uniref:Antitoxin n=1 Tax=Calidithermus roseus TaxID=1644118 RepID=A0A399EPH5_9DEIN|nr:type II toxin-antitoxin system prevent-host-death family antitoxin [Calidithermus roseus]RIH85878.1 prevent-host-death family protein [Calidithermus roseus]
MKVNIHQAKTQFSRLVERALQGEEIIIAKHGKPLLKLVPIQSQGQRPIGLHPRKLSEASIAASLAPLDEEALKDWYR